MLFAMDRNLRENKKPLKLECKSLPTVSIAGYNILDQTFWFSGNFNKVYKKITGKLQLLQSLKCYVSPDLFTKVYKGILLPNLLYNCTICFIFYY